MSAISWIVILLAVSNLLLVKLIIKKSKNMQLTHELVNKIVKGDFVNATFDFKEILKQKYSELKNTFKQEYKVHD